MASQAPALPDIYEFVIKHVDKWGPDATGRDRVLELAQDPNSFTICHRGLEGETNFRYTQDNDDTATCVINSINICRAMLRNPEVRSAFTKIAASYSQTYPTAWFLQDASPERKGGMNRVTDDFLQKILEKFPIVFVDHSFVCPRLYAACAKRRWDGVFKSSSQCIMVNGYNVDYMVRAARKEKKASNAAERKKHHENHRNFLFLHANSLFHEIGHLFIAYLSKDQESCATPTTMKGPLIFEKNPEKGEAGRKLEALVFGGTMEYMVDPDKKTIMDDECGAPYLVGENSVGEIVRWKILPETIKRTVKCEFKFPYDHEKDEEKRELTAVAEDIRMTKATDPMKDVMWSGKDERFRLPPSFFSVLRGAPCD